MPTMRVSRMAATMLAAGVLTIGPGTAALAAPALSPAAMPRITARPADLMVNAKTMLAGRGFRAHQKLLLRECSSTSWIVPAQPCTTGNGVRITTDAEGRFRASLKAEICPAVSPGTVGTQRTCYVGVPKPSGVDTTVLVGAAKILVSWP